MKEIGGYFEIEYSNIELGNLHTGALPLNSGRNCLAYILLVEAITKIYIPHYICDVVIEVIEKYNVAYQFYDINADLEIATLPNIAEHETLLYVNYFGLKNKYVSELASTHKNIIIDNSQALFVAPLPNITTFYSLRKFVGVPDGAFLYHHNTKNTIELQVTDSSHRNSHLYIRKNRNANAGYEDFKINESKFAALPIEAMSRSTSQFIKQYDFNKCKAIRENNYRYLHSKLSAINGISPILLADTTTPLVYPLLLGTANLRAKLLKYFIFIPTLWPNIENHATETSFEVYLAQNLLPLPIDQRYNTVDMNRMVDCILNAD